MSKKQVFNSVSIKKNKDWLSNSENYITYSFSPPLFLNSLGDIPIRFLKVSPK